MSSITNTQAFVICTKCEGKFVSVSPTRKMLLSMCSVLTWAGGRAGILTDSRQLCLPIRVKQRQAVCWSMSPVGQLRVTFSKKCEWEIGA